MEEWIIEEEVLLAASYYNAQSTSGVGRSRAGTSDEVPKAYLLLGDESAKHVQTPVAIDVRVDAGSKQLMWDASLVAERVRLVQVIHTMQTVVGLLVAGTGKCYSTFVLEIAARWPAVHNVFTYGRDGTLQCLDLTLGRQVAYVTAACGMRKYLPQKPAKAGGKETDLEEQSRVLEALQQKVAQIVTYLEGIEGELELPQEEILRQCWLLVCRLRRPPSRDIEEEILALETQCQLINVLTTQFETSMLLD
ncbi:ABR066Wp [Eremothecium gossypii ATCC 10895]|uniref:ABR066Wp n=1 Tax=Eremothecium gossypii (strain ATCC 10895 / CBS 109.51 / FGSC 9923 / NRRL Y-1056) TaxID=284811 RepID=Q75DG0_EREGS|nr:ABR066Wp [Eremothecium gossypii ATCC 10895]AAS50836.2 ABR066Wp [Eremothecium gossypii ATCC 10895]